MIIEHFGGKDTCEKLEDLENILSFRTGKGVNEFLIYGESQYPYLVLLVNNEYAYLHYYSKDDHPGFQVIGHDTDLDENENSTFYTNTDKEEVSIPNYAILPFSMALNVVKEFFETMDMPKSIEWDEL